MNWLIKNKQIVLCTLLLHMLFFLIKINLGDFYTADSKGYLYLAENIKDSFTFYSADLNLNIRFSEYTKRPPLYGIFVLLFSLALKSQVILIFIQNILSISSILLSYKLLDEHFIKSNRWIYFILVLGSMTPLIYSNLIMSEVLFQFLMVLLIFTIFKIIKNKSWKYLILFQLIIILLYLTKPVFYLFVFPNLLLGLWFSKSIENAFWSGLIPIVSLLLFMVWNQSRTGHFEFSSIQTINLVDYNFYFFHMNLYGEDTALASRRNIDELALQRETYKEQQKERTRLAVNEIKKELPKYVIFHLKGCLRMFFDPGRYDIYKFFQFENSDQVGFLRYLNKDGISGATEFYKSQPLLIVILLPIILLLNVIKFVGFVKFVISVKFYANPHIWFPLLLICYIVGLSGPIGSARFMLPILPFYCFFAMQGLLKNSKALPSE